MPTDKNPEDASSDDAPDTTGEAPKKKKAQPDEAGGPSGEEPTRYGDWERNGRCYDF